MARTPTTTRSPLAARFGHEEELSRHIADNHMEWLLGQIGVAAAGAPALEQRVASGARNKAGRLDIVQPTYSGTVIVEVQYGASDSSHWTRFHGYIKSVSTPFCLVWVAESFRDKDIRAIKKAGLPVICVQASGGQRLGLSIVDGMATVRLSSEDRVSKGRQVFYDGLADARKQFFGMIRSLFGSEGNQLAYAAWGGEILARCEDEPFGRPDESILASLRAMTCADIQKGNSLPQFSRERKWSNLVLQAVSRIPVDYRTIMKADPDFWGQVLNTAGGAMESRYRADRDCITAHHAA